MVTGSCPKKGVVGWEEGIFTMILGWDGGSAANNSLEVALEWI